jgi:hypothetical protein
MKKIIKLTESDLARIVKRVLKEQQAAAPAQGTNQTQGGTPGRRYQIADFTAFKPGMVVTFNDFVTKYRNSIKGVGENESIFFGYDKLQGDAKKQNLCGILNGGKTVVGPVFKQGATEDAISFFATPVKFVCQGTSPKYGNIEVRQINQNDANIIDSGKDESEKKYTTDAPYLITQA